MIPSGNPAPPLSIQPNENQDQVLPNHEYIGSFMDSRSKETFYIMSVPPWDHLFHIMGPIAPFLRNGSNERRDTQSECSQTWISGVSISLLITF